MRKLSLFIFSVLLTAACESGGGEPADVRANLLGETPAASPNIVIILADDLGYADISAYPSGRFPTPHIDRIGRQGVTFLQGYVTAPICSPSRAGLMTGRHQQRYGFEYNNGPPSRDVRDNLGLDTAELTLADILKAEGYATGLIGKWHLGSNDAYYPTARGFDYFWGFLTGQTNFIRPDAPGAINGAPVQGPDSDRWALERPVPEVDEANQVVTGPDRTVVDLGEGYLTEQITQEAVTFILQNRERPFFLYVGHAAPHTPLQTTQTYYDRFPDIEDHAMRVYAGMVSALDDSVGAILDTLESEGMAQSTIVIFLSDNGCAAYLPGLCSDAPLSGGKLTYLEGGIRVPFLMQWPARLKGGTVHDAPVSSLDILPTLAAASGARLPADRVYDGLDLVPQVTAGAQVREDALFWRTRPLRAVRSGNLKYLKDKSGAEFLYDISVDPTEKINLIEIQADDAALMRGAFEAWEAEMSAPAWPGREIRFEFGGRYFEFIP